MVFGIEKCKTLSIARRKLEKRTFTTEDDDTMEAMNKDDLYRYLGHMQSKQIKQAQMKQKHKKHIKDKVECKKYDKSYQYLCDPSTNF